MSAESCKEVVHVLRLKSPVSDNAIELRISGAQETFLDIGRGRVLQAIEIFLDDALAYRPPEGQA